LHSRIRDVNEYLLAWRGILPLRSMSRPAHVLDFAAERFGGSYKLEEVT
jgi:hypothetical protein